MQVQIARSRRIGLDGVDWHFIYLQKKNYLEKQNEIFFFFSTTILNKTVNF